MNHWNGVFGHFRALFEFVEKSRNYLQFSENRTILYKNKKRGACRKQAENRMFGLDPQPDLDNANVGIEQMHVFCVQGFLADMSLWHIRFLWCQRKGGRIC